MISELIRKKWGIDVDIREKWVTLNTVTLTELVGRNPNRLGLFLSNGGSGDALVGEGDNVLTSGYFYVTQSGGWVSFWWEEDMMFQCEQFSGVLLSGAGSMLVREIIAIGEV